ncbi:MAG: pyrroline-5-carboxylate reductase [Hyphomicrobiaceae bacterium]
MTLQLDGRLVLVGAGKMGGAMLSGWLARGLAPDSVIAVDPAPPSEVATVLATHGIRREAAVPALDTPPAVIVIAIKPQMMDQVFPQVAKIAGPGTLVISIAAGRTIASFEKHLPAGVAVIRTMPNTPAAIGRGITVCVANALTSGTQRATCESLLAAVGDVGWVEDEALIDAVTAVSGSGPAYVFLLAECMTAAGVAAGLDPQLAARLARATVSGAGELMRLSGEDPAQLRTNVTSPGGTTAAALSVLMAGDGLQPLLTKAILAARDRGRDLAG